MATLDEGELMARAVEGLAEVAAARLEERGGETVVGARRARATTAPTPCMPWPASPRPAGTPSRVHHDARPRGGPRGGRGGRRACSTTDPQRRSARPTSCSTASSASARDPACPTGRSAWLAAHLRRRPRHRRRPALGPGPDGRRARPRRGLRRRDGDLLGRQAGAPAARPPSRPAGSLTVVDIGLDARRPTRSCDGSTTTTSPRSGRCRRPTDDKYSRGVLGVVAGGEAYSGAAVLSVDRRGRGRRRHGALRRHADPDRPRAGRRARGRPRRRPGAGLGRRARARRRRRGPRGRRPSSTWPAWRWPATEPVVVDAGGLDLARRRGRSTGPGGGRRPCLTPHAGECAPRRLGLRRTDATARHRPPR